jgi:hypothetical protein
LQRTFVVRVHADCRRLQMDNLGGFSEDEKKLQEEFDDFYLDVYDDIKQ